MLYRTNTVIDFGKYNGFRLKEVIVANPGYVRWALREVLDFRITNKARRLLEQQPAPRRRRKLYWTYV